MGELSKHDIRKKMKALQALLDEIEDSADSEDKDPPPTNVKSTKSTNIMRDKGEAQLSLGQDDIGEDIVKPADEENRSKLNPVLNTAADGGEDVPHDVTVKPVLTTTILPKSPTATVKKASRKRDASPKSSRYKSPTSSFATHSAKKKAIADAATKQTQIHDVFKRKLAHSDSEGEHASIDRSKPPSNNKPTVEDIMKVMGFESKSAYKKFQKHVSIVTVRYVERLVTKGEVEWDSVTHDHLPIDIKEKIVQKVVAKYPIASLCPKNWTVTHLASRSIQDKKAWLLKNADYVVKKLDKLADQRLQKAERNKRKHQEIVERRENINDTRKKLKSSMLPVREKTDHQPSENSDENDMISPTRLKEPQSVGHGGKPGKIASKSPHEESVKPPRTDHEKQVRDPRASKRRAGGKEDQPDLEVQTGGAVPVSVVTREVPTVSPPKDDSRANQIRKKGGLKVTKKNTTRTVESLTQTGDDGNTSAQSPTAGKSDECITKGAREDSESDEGDQLDTDDSTAGVSTFSKGTEVILTYPSDNKPQTNVVGIAYFMGDSFHGHKLPKGFHTFNVSKVTRINAKKKVPFLDLYPESQLPEYENKSMGEMISYLVVWRDMDMKLPSK